MAKGRRLTTSRSERLLGSNYSYGNGQAPDVNEVSELDEEDVWPMADDTADRSDRVVSSSNGTCSPRAEIESSLDRMSISGSRRRAPPDDRSIGGLSLAFEDSSSGSNRTASPRIVHQFRRNDPVASASPRNMATSAPVNVPDWSKIYRVNSVESLHDSDDGVDDHESDMVPPHEYLAREYARSRKAGGASVVEGVGRTLKGRDMRRVRDAVWSQTGFDG